MEEEEERERERGGGVRIFVHYPLNTELANFAAKTVLLPGKLPTCKDISMQTVHYTKVSVQAVVAINT